MPCRENNSMRQHIEPSAIRHAFARAMSSMYATEVPQYGKLLSLVDQVNSAVLEADKNLRQKLEATDNLDRIHLERHGAIRVGKPEELAQVRRVLGIMNMLPTGYYNLASANVPVHATAFRPHKGSELAENPFRMFVSLLRLDLIQSKELRQQVQSTLSHRQIFSDRMFQLLERHDQNGGFVDDEFFDFVFEATASFRWHTSAAVSHEQYHQLLEESPILADIVAFKLPHINHLTPRALDIDAVQAGMRSWGMPLKDHIEGPPRRECPILLRQTSFKAIEEKIKFLSRSLENSHDSGIDDEFVDGRHKARFGEIEQRGAALTPKGRALYDDCLARAKQNGISAGDGAAYADYFAAFPDCWDAMRAQQLAWFRYYVEPGKVPDQRGLAAFDLEQGIRDGWMSFEALVYEDFLPISAAGIFQSNLRESGKQDICAAAATAHESQQAFEEALGCCVADEMALYEKLQEESIKACEGWWYK
ncbi:hypothetical protein Q7P37_005575 [Cladosporium fusiforme]